jgi:hypothetical protein
LDDLENRSDWRKNPVSELYNHQLIVQRLAHLKKEKQRFENGESINDLIFELRSGLLRNLGGILSCGKRKVFDFF